MSGFNVVNRIRRFRKNARGQGGSARQNNRQRSCSENAVSLRRLIKSTDTSDNKSSAGKTNVITKYFLKGSPSITQEIDYLFQVSVYIERYNAAFFGFPGFTKKYAVAVSL